MLQQGSPPSAAAATGSGGHQILQTSTGQQIIVLNQANAPNAAQMSAGDAGGLQTIQVLQSVGGLAAAASSGGQIMLQQTTAAAQPQMIQTAEGQTLIYQPTVQARMGSSHCVYSSQKNNSMQGEN